MQDERLDNIAQRFTDELLKLGCDANLESDYAIEHRIIPHPTRTGNLEIRLQVSRVRDPSVEAGRGNEVGYVFSSRGDVLNQEELSRVVGLELSIKDRTGKLSKPGLVICILRVKDEHAIWKYESCPSEGFGRSSWEETKQWRMMSERFD